MTAFRATTCLGVLLLCLLAPVAAGAAFLQPYTTTFTGSWAQTVAIGDVNGDGRNDVVVGTADSTVDPTNDSRLHVFLQGAAGTLGADTRYLAGFSIVGVAIGDVNNDGRNDVVAVGGADNMAVFLQTTGHTLATPVQFTLPLAPDSVAIGDLNDDGRDDVALSMVNANDPAGVGATMRVYYQGTTGQLATPTDFGVSPGRQNQVAIGDINGDGRQDAVFMSGIARAENLQVFRQSTTGTLVQSALAVAPFVATHGVAIADVTGDGRQDIIATVGDVQPTSQVAVIEQEAGGTLADPVFYPAVDLPIGVAAGDVTGDGRRDVVAVSPAIGNVSVYQQTAAGTLATPEVDVIPFAASTLPQDLAVGDINGDGLADVAIAHPDFGLVLLSAAAATLQVASVTPTSGATGVPTTTTVRAAFNAPLLASSVNAGTFTLTGPAGAVAGAVTLSADSLTATFTPTAALATNATYTARLVGGATGVQSQQGATLASDFTWTFTTGTTGNQAPVVAITSPPSGSTITGTTTVTATATDPDGVIVSVEFLVDGFRVIGDTIPPYTFSFNPLGVRAGNHTITARATDDDGLTATASITVNVPFPTATFADVPASSPFFAAVEAIAREGITAGCQQTPLRLFCPADPVSRQQMAVFLVRAMGQTPLNAATPTFADVPATSPFYGYIERLVQLGITSGCQQAPVRLFCPAAPVTRAQMAVFLVRAAGLTPFNNPFATFGDVPVGSSAYTYVEELYRAGITVGCSTVPSLYCPNSSITRAQMAVFLVRAFGIAT